MRILVSNDDGIYSPGIQALAEAAKPFGEVRVVAPDVEQSSMGHAITVNRPLSYRPAPVLKGFSAYRVNGTPADCVALGVSQWDQKVDLVLLAFPRGLAQRRRQVVPIFDQLDLPSVAVALQHLADAEGRLGKSTQHHGVLGIEQGFGL